MPPKNEILPTCSLEKLVEDVGLYPEDAYHFVQHGLSFTVERIHGKNADPEACRHISGQELCQGLRDFALLQWGMMAYTVLSRWNIASTLDFGRIVFAMVDSRFMNKTDEDSIDDFRNVFDFRAAFEGQYKIECK
jgi:uncharacterized repeat protein (TIGR04138 family)